MGGLRDQGTWCHQREAHSQFSFLKVLCTLPAAPALAFLLVGLVLGNWSRIWGARLGSKEG